MAVWCPSFFFTTVCFAHCPIYTGTIVSGLLQNSVAKGHLKYILAVRAYNERVIIRHENGMTEKNRSEHSLVFDLFLDWWFHHDMHEMLVRPAQHEAGKCWYLNGICMEDSSG